MKLRVLGCGDAFGSGGRFNTCFHLSASGRQYLVDCGASSMIAMRRFGVRPLEIDAILVSHMHGDHFGGIPFMLLHEEYEEGRERPLTIAGPPGIRARIDAACEVLFGHNGLRWRFPVTYVELQPGRRHEEVAGLEVEPFPVVHGNGPSYGLRIGAEGRLFAFSGDTAWCETLVPLAADADLLVMECFGYDEKCPVHCDYRTLEAHLPRLTAKRIALTHMGPKMLARRDEVALETLEDGMEIEI